MSRPNVLPDIDVGKVTASGYYNAIFEIGLKMLDVLALELGVDAKKLIQQINNPISQPCNFRYVETKQQTSDNAAGIDSHSDLASHYSWKDRPV